LFHVVVATGAVVTDVPFLGASVGSPYGPLTLGADGRLYGISSAGQSGSLFACDPVTGASTILHAFAPALGFFVRYLTLGADGRLYGSRPGGGAENAGSLFRYAPATNQFEQLYSLAPSNGVDGRSPGPLLAASDGHFYGATNRPNNGTYWSVLFRLRAGAGGTFTYEPLRQFPTFASGTLFDAAMTEGADGLIYGYGGGGPNGSGILFRFDPAGGGAPDPIGFTLLHTFPCLAPGNPSVPAAAADGLLYGMTSNCGANYRGAVYRLSPATGAVTHLGDVPGAPASTTNSSLVAGTDGFLYGTSTAYISSYVTSILRVEPSTGTPTVAVAAVGPPSASVVTGLVRTPAGQMFGM
jgi:uncharacterized repeat protein (TIGR03803 family)